MIWQHKNPTNMLIMFVLILNRVKSLLCKTNPLKKTPSEGEQLSNSGQVWTEAFFLKSNKKRLKFPGEVLKWKGGAKNREARLLFRLYVSVLLSICRARKIFLTKFWCSKAIKHESVRSTFAKVLWNIKILTFYFNDKLWSIIHQDSNL